MTSNADVPRAHAKEPGLFKKVAQDLWGFITSIRLAIVLIALIALLGTLGTLFPQADKTRSVDYIERYGLEGYRWIKTLQLDEIFSSTYFLFVMSLFSLNMLACTCKRLRASLRYYRLAQRPKLAKAFEHMPIRAQLSLEAVSAAATLDRAHRLLRRKRYRVRRISENQLLAEKWRWERFGIDVFHVGILILLVGGFLTATAGYRVFQVAHAGQVFSVPGRDFKVQVDEFWSENYADTERVMDWHSTLTVLEAGRKVLTKTIEVNAPLYYRGVRFFQSSFGQDWENAARVSVRVETEQGKTLGTYLASVGQRFAVPELGIQVEVAAFLPDFALTENKIAYSRSQRLNNPGVFLRVFAENGQLVHRTWALSQMPELQKLLSEAPYRFYLEGMSAPEFTGIQINYDPGYNVAIASFVVMLLGILVHLYFKHRQVWVLYDGDQQTLCLGGKVRNASKGFKHEFDQMVEQLRLSSP